MVSVSGVLSSVCAVSSPVALHVAVLLFLPVIPVVLWESLLEQELARTRQLVEHTLAPPREGEETYESTHVESPVAIEQRAPPANPSGNGCDGTMEPVVMTVLQRTPPSVPPNVAELTTMEDDVGMNVLEEEPASDMPASLSRGSAHVGEDCSTADLSATKSEWMDFARNLELMPFIGRKVRKSRPALWVRETEGAVYRKRSKERKTLTFCGSLSFNGSRQGLKEVVQSGSEPTGGTTCLEVTAVGDLVNILPADQSTRSADTSKPDHTTSGHVDRKGTTGTETSALEDKEVIVTPFVTRRKVQVDHSARFPDLTKMDLNDGGGTNRMESTDVTASSGGSTEADDGHQRTEEVDHDPAKGAIPVDDVAVPPLSTFVELDPPPSPTHDKLDDHDAAKLTPFLARKKMNVKHSDRTPDPARLDKILTDVASSEIPTIDKPGQGFGEIDLQQRLQTDFDQPSEVNEGSHSGDGHSEAFESMGDDQLPLVIDLSDDQCSLLADTRDQAPSPVHCHSDNTIEVITTPFLTRNRVQVDHRSRVPDPAKLDLLRGENHSPVSVEKYGRILLKNDECHDACTLDSLEPNDRPSSPAGTSGFPDDRRCELVSPVHAADDSSIVLGRCTVNITPFVTRNKIQVDHDARVPDLANLDLASQSADESDESDRIELLLEERLGDARQSSGAGQVEPLADVERSCEDFSDTRLENILAHDVETDGLKFPLRSWFGDYMTTGAFETVWSIADEN